MLQVGPIWSLRGPFIILWYKSYNGPEEDFLDVKIWSRVQGNFWHLSPPLLNVTWFKRKNVKIHQTCNHKNSGLWASLVYISGTWGLCQVVVLHSILMNQRYCDTKHFDMVWFLPFGVLNEDSVNFTLLVASISSHLIMHAVSYELKGTSYNQPKRHICPLLK